MHVRLHPTHAGVNLRSLDVHQALELRSTQTAKYGAVHVQQTVPFTQTITE